MYNTKMKNVIIFHGTGDTNKLYWFPYLKRELEKKGYKVWLPQLPNAKNPNLADWLSFVLKNGSFTKDTILIGHSAGAQLILSLLEKVKVGRAILVSGYAEPLPKTSNSKQRDVLNWKIIRKHIHDIIFIHSDNDPWGCGDKQGKILLNNLGGTLIIRHGEGHMGSTTYKQPYKKFPLIVKLIELEE